MNKEDLLKDVPIDDPIPLYIDEISKISPLSHEEEVDLAKRAKSGDEDAKRILIEANLRLVVSLAKEYLGRGISLIDLIIEGNMGLVKAVDNYSEQTDRLFSDFAEEWIRQPMEIAVSVFQDSEQDISVAGDNILEDESAESSLNEELESKIKALESAIESLKRSL